MRRTSVGVVASVVVIAAIVGFGIDQLLTVAGRATFTPSLLLPVLLVVLAVVDVALGVRVQRSTRVAGAVNPFQAVRVVLLAQASAIVGAAVAGVGLGLLIFLLTRPVTPPGSSTGAALATLGGGVVLVIAALITEHLCTIRKDDDDDERPDPPAPELGLSHRD